MTPIVADLDDKKRRIDLLHQIVTSAKEDIPRLRRDQEELQVCQRGYNVFPLPLSQERFDAQDSELERLKDDSMRNEVQRQVFKASCGQLKTPAASRLTRYVIRR